MSFFFLPLLPLPSFPTLRPQVQTLIKSDDWAASYPVTKAGGSIIGGKHVAISPQSSPSTPGWGRNKIDTGPDEKHDTEQIKMWNNTNTLQNIPATSRHVIHVQYETNRTCKCFILPETLSCWVCSCVASWRRKRCPPCSGTGSSPVGCCRHRRFHCDRHRCCKICY